jgi:tetratricopeptide (TPR) repeat protein
MAPTFEYDVFLSHRGAQKDWTENLARRLRSDGFKVWFDKWELNRNLGKDWIDQLRIGVESSNKVVLVLSPEFFAGDWTVFESRIIQLLDPVGREGRVIPVLHTPYKVPRDWSFRQALDFTNAPLGTVDFEFRYHQLVHNIDPSRPYEGDFEEFKKLHAGKKDSTTIPPVQPLPRGSHMPHAPNPLFVGREDEMRSLAKMLVPGSGATVGVHAAVQGMGGVGKTQLAIEYAFRYGNLYRGGVFWLNFAKEEEIITEVAACGGHEAESIPNWNAMKPPDQAKIVQKLWHESDQPRLLIFDNAEDPALVEKWRPKHGRCSVLITCRRDEWPAKMGVKPLPIETLPREKSLELLAEARSSIANNTKDRETADKICDLLGDLPLALTVAAAYLKKYKNDSLAEYLEALSSQPAIKDSSLEKEISACFAVSFNKLDPANPTDALAHKLFYLAAFFAPVSINGSLLAGSAGLNYTKREERHQADDALSRLQELGLIKQEPDSRLLLHRLLREFARQNPPQDMNSEAAFTAVCESLNDFGVQEYETGLPHALAQERGHFRYVAIEVEHDNPEFAARLHNLLGLNGKVLALFLEAKVDAEKAVALAEVVHGLNHAFVASCINNLAAVLQSLGKLAEARANYERALKIDEIAYGPDHPAVAIQLNNLGSLLLDMGDFPGARNYLERARRIDEAIYGPDHPKIITELNNLGLVLRQLGDLAGARTNFERALKIAETSYGSDHPNVATLLSTLGLVLTDLGDLEGARANFQRGLKIDEAIYGLHHPKVAIRLNNLGLVLKKLGDLEGARNNYERALMIDQVSYGPNHFEVAINLSNLGMVLQSLGDVPGARANFERALQIFKNALGDNHPHTRTVQQNLDSLNEKH